MITAWIVVTVVSKSSTRALIETFIADWSSTMTNWARASATSGNQLVPDVESVSGSGDAPAVTAAPLLMLRPLPSSGRPAGRGSPLPDEGRGRPLTVDGEGPLWCAPPFLPGSRSAHDLEVEGARAEVPISRNQTGSNISVPRAVSSGPRSMTSSWPKLSRSETTVALAGASSPETKTVEDSPRVFGSTISEAVMVFRVLTTFASGKARWICSPSESVSLTNMVGGKPWEKSRGLAMSTSTLPARLSAPARPSTSRAAAPEEALTTSSAPAAASANVARPTP